MRGMIWDRQYLSGWLSFGSGHISRVSPVFELTTQGDFSPKIPSGKYDQTYIKKNENNILDFHVKQTSSGGWLSTWWLIIKKKLRKTVKLILDYSKGAKLSISIPSQSLEGEASEGSFQDFLSFVKRSSKPFFFYFQSSCSTFHLVFCLWLWKQEPCHFGCAAQSKPIRELWLHFKDKRKNTFCQADGGVDCLIVI